MHVGLIGEGVAIDLVEAQVAPFASSIQRLDRAQFNDVDVIIASVLRGQELEELNERAVAAGQTLVTIEAGTLGGQPIDVITAAVAVLSGDGPCYSCLQQRVSSTTDTEGSRSDIDVESLRVVGALAGQIVAGAIREDRPPAAGTLVEWPYRERTLLPVPGCPSCDPDWDQRWDPSDGAGERSLEEALGAAERSFDARVGLVTEIGEAASWPLPYYLATLADTTVFSDARVPPHAAGVAEDWNRAFMKGLGEALERYSAACYADETLTVAHPDELESTIAPDRFVRPLSSDPIDVEIPWIPGIDAGTDNRRWIPADLVVFPPPRRIVRPGITTGLAIGNTADQAVTSGLLEVLERDAAMLAWYSTFEPVGLDVDDPTFARLVKLAGLEDLTVNVVLLTQDVDVPIVGAFVSREAGWPRFAAGSAAGFDPVETTTDALREAIQNWMELSEMGPEVAKEESPRIAAYAEDPDDLGAFIAPTMSVAASELTGSLAPTLEGLLTEVREVGMTPAVAWITPRDLERLGFVAVRAVVPEAQPLLMGSPYFGDRAEQVPQSMGFRPCLDRAPHPFP